MKKSASQIFHHIAKLEPSFLFTVLESEQQICKHHIASSFKICAQKSISSPSDEVEVYVALQCLVPLRLWCLASLLCGQGGHGGNGRSQQRRCEMHGVQICIERVTKMEDS